MKKSVGIAFGMKRRAILALGLVLSLAFFGFVTWRTSANEKQGNSTVATTVSNDTAAREYSVDELHFPKPDATPERRSRTGVPDGGPIVNVDRKLTPTQEMGLTQIAPGLTPASTLDFAASRAPEAATTFNYTGAMQTYMVPAGVTSVTIEVFGAGGGTGAVGNSGSGATQGGPGGMGSKAQGVLAVVPGQVLNVFVGGSGGVPTGGFNGGANGGSTNAGGGGGASDVRYPGTGPADRLIVGGAGGGGGRGGCQNSNTINGGAGGAGDGNGGNGTNSANGGGGFGAVGTVFGASGIGCGGFLGSNGVGGLSGTGGNGGAGQSCCCFSFGAVPGGGGGGGGFNGGGGGGGGSAGTTGCLGNDKGAGGGGAGGTSHVGGVTAGAVTPGVQSGNGVVVITPGSPVAPPCVTTPFTQDFDGVAAPALPAGWAATQGVNSTGAPLWVTSATTPDTAPNAAFSTDPSNLLDNRLDTPGIPITSAAAQVSFRHRYDFENSFDGGVLEISSPNISAGAFTDIITAGGLFVAGGYNGTISNSFGSPIAGRQAWTGTSAGYITTTVNLPPSVNGQTVKLRFRAGADNSVSGIGWRVDTVSLTEICLSGQVDLAITKTDGITNFTAPGQTTYTIVVTNNGPNPAVNALVTDNFPAGVTVDNWTCLPQNQALCRLAGAGNINELVYIPVGGILTYTATATVAANQTGQLINTATVTPPAGLTDTNISNNSATDTDNFVMSISGNVKQFVSGGPNTNLAGVTLTLAGTNSGTATSGPDGNYTFTNLTSGGTWTVTPSMSGKVFDPTSRTVTGATANVTGVNFIAYNGTGGIPRNIFVVNTHATPGNPVTVPIRMTSQGTEKVMTFSIDYPIGVLFTPVVACGASTPGCAVVSNNATLGKIGVSITAAGAGVAAGLREIATVTFQTNVGFAPPNAALNFSATPTAQSVRDAAGNELQKTFTNGFVVFVDGVESDVAARNTGDGNVLTTDVTQVRRFVVGTDTVNLSFNEFQRADAAPIFTLGDGELLPGDVIQARRYSARLDNLQAAGGPAGPPPPPLGPTVAPIEEIAETSRVIRTERVTADPGQQVTVGVDIEPQGDEMAAAFTLEYNAARLGNARVTLADDAPEGAVLTVNSDDAASGRIGILIDANQPFARDSSARRLVNVTFDVAANSAGGEARIRFTDATAKRGVSDDLGNTLDARYTDGAVMISGPEARGYELTGRVTTPDGRGLRGAQVTIVDENGLARTVTTSAFGFYRFEDLAAGENYVVSVTSRRHRFAARTITLNDNLADVDFAAQE